MKRFLTFLLLGLVGVTLVLAIYRLSPQSVVETEVPAIATEVVLESPDAATLVEAEPRIRVTYFTNNVRCTSCRRIEALTRAMVAECLSSEQRAGRVEFRMINVDEPANRHFIEDYQLVSKSVVIATLNGTKELSWRNMDRIWTLLGNEDAFIRYLCEEAVARLKEGRDA